MLLTNVSMLDPMYRSAFRSWLRYEDRIGFRTIGALATILHRETNRTTAVQGAWLTNQAGQHIVARTLVLGSVEYDRQTSCGGLRRMLCNEAAISRHRPCRDHATTGDGSVKATRHGSRRDYYEPQSCAIIARRFEHDFAKFGFETAACP